MTSPSIALATRADLDDLAAMVNGAYRGETARRGWTHEADLLGGQRTDARALADELDAPDPGIILLLREAAAGPILGCVLMQRVRDAAERPLCHLAMLTVRPERQGAGLGALLIGEVERRARGLGCVAVEMTVLQGRADLIAFYRRRGYAPTGRTRPFPYGEPRFGLPHRDDLQFVVLEKPLSPA